MKLHLIFLAFILFSGCSNAPENGQAFIITDLNDSNFTESKPTEEKNETSEEIQTTLSYTGKSSVSIEKAQTSTISFTIKNLTSSTEVLAKSSSNSTVFVSSPQCNTSNCSVSFVGISSGKANITISLKDNSTENFIVAVTVTEPIVQLPKEVLTFDSSSKDLVNSGISLDIGESVKVGFFIENRNSDTTILVSNNKSVDTANVKCNNSVCEMEISGVSDGTDRVKAYVKNNTNIYLTVPITVKGEEIIETIPDEVEENSSEPEESQPEENLTIDRNQTFSLGTPELAFASGQSTNVQVNEGADFMITTILTNPRNPDEKLLVIPTTDKRVEVLLTTLDVSLSDNTKFVFRTTITPVSAGVERIAFRIADSNLSIGLDVTIKQATCGLNIDSYNILKSGESNSQIVLGTRLGFNSVEIIYPKIQTETTIGFQDFSYISDNGDGTTSHSESLKSAFAFMKFAEDFEFLEYKIKYRKDGNISLICLDGIFPNRNIVQIEDEVAPVEETEPPETPPN